VPNPDIRIIGRCVADRYAGPGSQIIEYNSPAGGGLIAFTLTNTGRLTVDLYRHDSTVDIRVGVADPATAPDSDHTVRDQN
jgi:hypothetical protein